MKIKEEESEIKSLFDGLRQQDAAGLPRFERVVRASTRRPETRLPFSLSSLGLTAGASAVAALILALASFYTAARKDASALQEWSALSGWQASTDSFLSASSNGWGSPITTTSDAWLQNWNESESSATTQQKRL